jgi:hypothetical protein
MTTGTDDRQISSSESTVSVEYAQACFELRGSEVYWRSRPVEHFSSEHAWKVFQTKYSGKPAGRKERNGYVSIHMRYRGTRIQFQAHRVVWMLHHGAWPTLNLDHINRVRSDNRPENLREVTTAENNKNAARNRVYPYVAPYAHSGGSFAAQVKIGTRSIHIGIFDTAEDADAHRLFVCAELEKLALSLAKNTPKPKTYRKRDEKAPKGPK